MQSFTTTDLQRNLGDVQDAALLEPVSITRNGREKYVFLSVREYERLKRHDREVLQVHELSEEDVRAIAAAKVPAEYAYLDELL